MTATVEVPTEWPKVGRVKYVFTPQEDITAYELAQCVMLIEYGRSWNGWPPDPVDRLLNNQLARRHFTFER